MQLPLFFHDGPLDRNAEILLDEETARHVVQVLRMQEGERLMLTDGKGVSANVVIGKADRKKCRVEVTDREVHNAARIKLYLVAAFTKNSSRNEWLLEKATELGVAGIIPVSSRRSERERFRYDRWKNIITSALLQSRQFYLPELSEMSSLEAIFEKYSSVSQKLIGHCIDGVPRTPLSLAMQPATDTIVLIGPEGDFTSQEVEMAISEGYSGIHLGSHRLRTETAAMAVCAYFNLINYEA